MKYRLFVGIVVCSLLFILCIGLWWWLSRPAPILVDTLSGRAQDFISAQRQTGSGLWSEVSIERSPTVASTSSKVEVRCFTVELPAAVNIKQEESEKRCRVEGRLIDPMTLIVIGAYPVASFAEDTAITLRRSQPEVYEEWTIETAAFSQVRMFRSSDSITAFAWQNGMMYTVSATGFGSPHPGILTTVTAILASFQVK